MLSAASNGNVITTSFSLLNACSRLVICCRSLPEMDEMADALHKQFDGRAALRVSAAGLGGRVCIHTDTSIATQVMSFLSAQGWSVRLLQPSSPTQLVQF
jgi:hypothetical protein